MTSIKNTVLSSVAECMELRKSKFVSRKSFYTTQVVFFHKPSKFLIVSDFFWNYPDRGTQLGTQAWKFGMDRVYGPFYRSFMIREKGESSLAAHAINITLFKMQHA